MSKDFICFRCERRFAEMEQAEVCEASHIGIPKPARRQKVAKRAENGARRRTRSQVIAAIWRRDKGLCRRCGKRCVPARETYPTDPDRGEVNDIVPRSLGGDPLDETNQELLCHACHFSGPSGAHAPTRGANRC